MVDIYPIRPANPQMAALKVIGKAFDAVRNVTDKPVIFIAQAFGGGESYVRAPSTGEERVMTVSTRGGALV